jgi:hypothetical protein
MIEDSQGNFQEKSQRDFQEKILCGRRDLNPHAEAPVPKTGVSAISPLPLTSQGSRTSEMQGKE